MSEVTNTPFDEIEDEPVSRFQTPEQFFQEASIGEGIHLPVMSDASSSTDSWINVPLNLVFYCGSAKCGRKMDFRYIVKPGSGLTQVGALGSTTAINYSCNYCASKHSITLAVGLRSEENPRTRWFVKAGEWPPEYEANTEELLNLVGKAGRLFQKGYECERLKFGIGAFAYYRLVVVMIADELIGRILKVAKTLQADETTIKRLEEALKTTQFERKMNLAYNALPKELFILGQNPLQKVHNVFSKPLHTKTEDQCLQDALKARLILTAIARKVTDLADEERLLRDFIKDSVKSGVNDGADASAKDGK